MSFFRPDASAATIRSEATAAHATGSFIVGLRDQQSREVRSAQARLAAASVDRELGRLAVSTLVNAGGSKRTVGALKAAGFGDVRSVARRNAAQLAAVRGVGATGAQSAHFAAQRIKQSLLEDFSIRIERQDRSVEADALLVALQEYRRAANTSNDVLENAKSVRRGTGNGLEATELALHPWRYLFSKGAVKEQLNRDLATLGKYTRSGAPALARAFATQWKHDAKSVSIDELWDESEQDRSTFYSLLAAATGSGHASTADLGNLGGGLGAGAADDGELSALVKRITSTDLDVDGHLRVVLRPYQEFGVQFALEQRRIILGDEMGLGKTIEAIAAMCHLAARGETHFIVAVPLSLVAQWVRELAHKSDLPVHRPHGPKFYLAFWDWCARGGVAVVSIDTLKSVQPSSLKGASIGLLVIDEAQMVKNPTTMRSWGMQSWIEESARTMMLTGSPLENRVDEFLALETLLRPSATSLLPQSARYSPARFRRAVAPIYLRRQQADVLRELPPIIHADEWVSLTEAEGHTYRDASWSRNIHTLRQAAFAREIAEPTKLSRISQIVADARANGKKVVIFSFYRDVLKRVAETLEGESPVFGPLDGKVPVARRDLLVTDFTDALGHAVLVAQIVTGGQGLNLQCASVAILCEPQLKPSSESQAVARLQRMGQAERVQVHRLIAESTVDEALLAMLERKQKIFDEYAGKSDLADEARRLLDMGEKQLSDELVAAEFERVGGIEPSDAIG